MNLFDSNNVSNSVKHYILANENGICKHQKRFFCRKSIEGHEENPKEG
jgi:hypothetical protein